MPNLLPRSRCLPLLLLSLTLPAVAEAQEGRPASGQKAYAETSQRGNARIFFWGDNHSIGQLAVDYGQPMWSDRWQQMLEGEQMQGKRWRLGQNFWTNLDSNVPLTLGEQRIEAGYWYLSMEHRGDDGFVLWILDPAQVREQKLDAYHAHKTRGGIEVPLVHSESGELRERLTIRLDLDPEQGASAAVLRIEFGPHRLEVPVFMHVGH